LPRGRPSCVAKPIIWTHSSQSFRLPSVFQRDASGSRHRHGSTVLTYPSHQIDLGCWGLVVSFPPGQGRSWSVSPVIAQQVRRQLPARNPVQSHGTNCFLSLLDATCTFPSLWSTVDSTDGIGHRISLQISLSGTTFEAFGKIFAKSRNCYGTDFDFFFLEGVLVMVSGVGSHGQTTTVTQSEPSPAQSLVYTMQERVHTDIPQLGPLRRRPTLIFIQHHTVRPLARS
jgi:hypothetical protein